MVHILIHPVVPPAPAKEQIHYNCQIECTAFLSHVPIGNVPYMKKCLTRKMFLVCMHRQHGFTGFPSDLVSVTRCSNDKAVENWDLRNTTSLFMRIAFITKLLLERCCIHIVLEVQKLIQRTICQRFQRALKKKRGRGEEGNQRSVPRTITVGSDHRGYCTISFLSSSSLNQVCIHLYKRSELCKPHCKIS